MIVLYPAGALREFYDRNALRKDIAYNAAVGPHADTQRQRYTVPAGKKAVMFGYGLSVQRYTAAGTASWAFIDVVINKSQGDELAVGFVQINSNTVAVQQYASLATYVLLKAGDTVDIRTADISTGGTCMFQGHCSIIEYDAA